MKLFGNKKENSGDKSSSPVASEKTKSSVSFLKRTVSKIGSLFSKTNTENTAEPMSNAKYLGEIYKLMVQNSVDIKLEREQQVNFREEEDSEEQKRHSEIIRALTIRRRPKPKAVIRREKKAEEKAKEPPKKTGEPPKKPADPAKPAETPKKPADPAKPAEKPVEKAKKEVDDGVKKAAEEKARKDAQEAAKKEAETKAKKEAEEKAKKAAEEKARKDAQEAAKKEAETKAKKEAEEKAKKETAEKLKKEEQEKLKREAAEKAKADKLKEQNKPDTATQQPPTPSKPVPNLSTAQKIALGTAPAIIGGLLMPSQSVASAIDKASTLVGVSRPLMYAMANQESKFNPNIKADTSSATGLYQFLKGSWSDMVKKYGKDYPILEQKGVTDPEANAIAGALFIKENSEVLKKAGIPINASTIYTAHFLGAGGARSFFKLNDDDIAAKKLPKAADANKYVFYKLKKDKTGKKLIPDLDNPKTVKEVKEFLFQKVGQYEEKYAKGLENISTSNSGSQVNQSSIQNNDMKKQDTPAPINIQQNTTNVNNTTESSNAPKVDDRPAHQRK